MKRSYYNNPVSVCIIFDKGVCCAKTKEIMDLDYVTGADISGFAFAIVVLSLVASLRHTYGTENNLEHDPSAKILSQKTVGFI